LKSLCSSFLWRMPISRLLVDKQVAEACQRGESKMKRPGNDGRNATPRDAIDEEKVQIRRSCSYIVAREASDLMSKLPLNRGPAMKKIAERLVDSRSVLFGIAFFECVEDWLLDHGQQASADAVRRFLNSPKFLTLFVPAMPAMPVPAPRAVSRGTPRSVMALVD
jgi:hypothetical protein